MNVLRTEPLTFIAALPRSVWYMSKGAVPDCVVEGLVMRTRTQEGDVKVRKPGERAT